MASIKQIASGRKDLFMVDPRLLKEEEGWNARIPSAELDQHIEDLALSIAENGVLEPLTVFLKGDDLYVTNGHCRRMATLLAISRGAEIVSVPVRVEEKHASDADRVLSMVTRNSGKPLSMLEMSSVVKRLAAFGWETKKIAAKTGYSVQHVENLLTLSGAPEELKNQVAQGQVSATNAVSLVKEHGEEAPRLVKEETEKTGKKMTMARKNKAAIIIEERIKIAEWLRFYPQIHDDFLREFPI